ncbi:MAG: NADH-quinone oxidoreductase subunit J [Desulfovibrionaceae bacterium]|nr:NADH-quinone oxidoreductase subunit J [Desulfovibrionaceae bacterium]MDD4952232.1 NADH-quinone oxidoreductase subunit J [Desulfovibrionaceae bacterium]
MELMAKISFVIYALIILGGGLVAVTSQSLVRALVGLISTLLGVAGMYMLLATPFMAFMQILIYVGAVAVIVFFAVMLTRADEGGEEADPAPIRQSLGSLAAVAAVGGVLSWVLLTKPVQGLKVPVEVAVEELGKGLMESYFVAFELISVILLVAMSGAVLLAWERRVKK